MLPGVIFQLSQIFTAALAAGVIGIFLWWLVRKKLRRVTLPTVKILELPRRNLPKIAVRKPPLLLFMVFALSALILLFFSAKPLRLAPSPQMDKKLRIHMFVDLSPSVGAFVSQEVLQNKIAEVYSQIAEKGTVSISHSHDNKIQIISDSKALQPLIKTWTFQNAGVRIANVLSRHLEDAGSIDWLVIISDRDHNSWAGFNWQSLQDNMFLSLVDFASGKEVKKNVYFSDIIYLGNPSFSRQQWQASIVRNNADGELKGDLVVTKKGEELARSSFVFADGMERLEMNMAWQATAAGVGGENHLLWHLIVDSDNDLASDDYFHTREFGSVKMALNIGGIRGEHYLRDHTYYFQKILELFGFRVKQQETVGNESAFKQNNDLITLFFDGDLATQRNCPRREWLLPDAKDSNESRRLWLVPSMAQQSFQDACHCLQLLKGESLATADVCADVYSRNSYIDLLVAWGGKQIGGNISDRYQAPVYTLSQPGLQLFAFTLPLYPQKGSLSHGEIPILVKQLLQLSDTVSNDYPPKMAQWLRLSDYDPYSQQDLGLMRDSNVPEEESRLKMLTAKLLPPAYTGELPKENPYSALQQDVNDPTPLIRWGLLGFGLLLLLEMGAEFFYRRRQLPLALWLAAIFTGGVLIEPCEAQIIINRISSTNTTTFKALSQETADRTSIDLLPTAKVYRQFEPKVLDEPWLIVDSLEQIAENDGKIRQDVLLWLKRGGFLLITSSYAPEKLQKFLQLPQAEGWKIIPPDHELTRSFYLLDSLPGCGELWYGFHFDGRLAALAMPVRMFDLLSDQPTPLPQCKPIITREGLVRAFVNAIMVALTTDYKKDQIHLPEILKRLR